MNSKNRNRSFSTGLILGIVALAGLTSCSSNDELQDRLDQRDDAYSNLQDRRTMRMEARDKRSDDWYERVMR